MLAGLPRGDSDAASIVREKIAVLPAGDPAKFNLEIAELSCDPTATTAKIEPHIPHATPAQISELVRILAPHPERFRAVAWKAMEDSDQTDRELLNWACLAAQFDPENSAWQNASRQTVRALLRQHPLDLGGYAELLEPVRLYLSPSLVDEFGEADSDPMAQEVIASLLSRFAADDSDALVKVLVEMNGSGIRLLWPAIQQHADAAIVQLRQIANQPGSFEQLAANPNWQTDADFERNFDAGQRRRANALAALWRLGHPDDAMRALQSAADPALRAWLIETAAPAGIGVDEFLTRLQKEPDPGVRQALALALGQVDWDQLSPSRRRTMVDVLSKLYGEDPDAGVHSACRWVLAGPAKSASVVEATDGAEHGPPPKDRQWSNGPNGHTFIALRGPYEFEMGSPDSEMLRESDETLVRVKLSHGFAIASEETTIAQFVRFRGKLFIRRYSPTDDCPANSISWYEAAAYCRWLSEQDGVPEDQMCYPPMADIKPGMKLPEDWYERTGFRLPLEAEWEFACRAGVPFSRFCGEGAQMPMRYMWFLKNSGNRAQPVGSLKPNPWGMFDMLGNVAERCHDVYEPYPASTEAISPPARAATNLTVGEEPIRVFRGGNFGDIDANLRSARRAANAPLDQWALTGFRPVRTLRP